MSSLGKIREPIESHLVNFESMLLEVVSNKYISMGEVVGSMLNLNGKRMRPILTLLVAKMLGQVSDSHIAGAVIMEITHNASLIHDDVIDDAIVRRGEPTLNTHIGSKGAVLAGDFLLACGIETGVKYENFRAIGIAARTLKQLVEGELEQAMCAKSLSTTQEDYYRIIDLKTAYLLGASAAVGASGEDADLMYRFGCLIGQAYQIKDDVLDYIGVDSGKELYNDIRERKITLPLLFAIEQLGNRESVEVDLALASDGDKAAVARVVEYVLKSNAIERCGKEIARRKEEALALLDKFEDCDAKRSLGLFCEFVMNRDF